MTVEVKSGNGNGSNDHPVTFSIAASDSTVYSATQKVYKGNSYTLELKDGSGNCFPEGQDTQYYKITTASNNQAGFKATSIKLVFPKARPHLSPAFQSVTKENDSFSSQNFSHKCNSSTCLFRKDGVYYGTVGSGSNSEVCVETSGWRNSCYYAGASSFNF
mmetsp:Transcript_14374/g.29780  ORF Transcript_14374/g.29780 Transcript_14374/m.29780 type:complete len:161 (-) Transcript_14374:1385-1867(-)